MNDNIWKRNEIESPCVKICVIHPAHQICVGCFRTADEIGDWSNFTAEKRKNIMACLKDRKKLTRQKRQGGRLRTIKD